jgi:LysR family nitrogen assimilation transcriptional regulator
MFIDDRQLRFFREIAEHRSINRAATRLHITQPALSRRMKSLEHQIGAELFVRSKSGVDLTPAGRRLLERSKFINDAFEALGEAKTADASIATSIGVGIAPGASLLVLDLLVRAFHETLPNQTLRLIEGIASEMSDKVLDGELQVALISGVIGSPHLEAEVIWREPLYFVEPAGHAGALAFAMPTRDPLISGFIEDALRQLRFESRVDFEICSSPLIKRLVSGGHACSILPYSAVHEELASGDLRCTLLPGKELPRTLLWHKARRPSEVIDSMRIMMRGLARELVSQSSPHNPYLRLP